jgi:hypothetical protein
MNSEKYASIDSISEGIDELCRRLDENNRLISQAVNPAQNEPALSMKESASLHRGYVGDLRLKEALREAIEELEESRKSFKSKRLENLRKKLIRVLMEN